MYERNRLYRLENSNCTCSNVMCINFCGLFRCYLPQTGGAGAALSLRAMKPKFHWLAVSSRREGSVTWWLAMSSGREGESGSVSGSERWEGS